jgi:hypothetical protein
MIEAVNGLLVTAVLALGRWIPKKGFVANPLRAGDESQEKALAYTRSICSNAVRNQRILRVMTSGLCRRVNQILGRLWRRDSGIRERKRNAA